MGCVGGEVTYAVEWRPSAGGAGLPNAPSHGLSAASMLLLSAAAQKRRADMLVVIPSPF